MAQSALANTTPARAGCSRRWHNSLPAWIVQDAGYERLSQSVRQTLHAIADTCDPPSPHGDGSLTVAFGGQPLNEAAGCSGRTFWRHVKLLIGTGYVVLLGRGGAYGGRTYGNQYGLPGRRGALDERGCRQRLQRMVRHDDGAWRPVVIEPGTQATLWGPQDSVDNLSDSCAQLPSCPQPPCHSVTGGSDSLSRGPCQSVTPPYPHESPYEKNHGGLTENRHPRTTGNQNNNGAGRQRQQRRHRRGGIHIDSGDLASTPHLLNLFRAYCEKGIVRDSEDDRMEFFAMAEHVLAYRDHEGRPPKNPEGMFASNVRQARWLWVTEQHRQAAQRRLREFLQG